MTSINFPLRPKYSIGMRSDPMSGSHTRIHSHTCKYTHRDSGFTPIMPIPIKHHAVHPVFLAFHIYRTPAPTATDSEKPEHVVLDMITHLFSPSPCNHTLTAAATPFPHLRSVRPSLLPLPRRYLGGGQRLSSPHSALAARPECRPAWCPPPLIASCRCQYLEQCCSSTW